MQVLALGFSSVFDQILDTLTEDERKDIFSAYITALGESPEQYRKDAASLEQLASTLSGPDALTPSASGNELQQTLAKLAEASGAGTLAYNKFFAIGLFRLLELTGAKEPAALERLVKALNVKPEYVNRDLLMYKVGALQTQLYVVGMGFRWSHSQPHSQHAWHTVEWVAGWRSPSVNQAAGTVSVTDRISISALAS